MTAKKCLQGKQSRLNPRQVQLQITFMFLKLTMYFAFKLEVTDSL